MFQWILHIVESGGYAGIFLLMMLENIFPPIPSEVVIPLAGFAAARGDLSVLGVIVATTLGGLVGCIPWYFLGRFFGIRRLEQLSERYGRLLTLSPEDVRSAQAWFHTHGHLAVFFGRLMPAVRTLISVPAGIAHMPFWRFLLYSLFGTLVWNSTLLFCGYVLETQYEKIAVYVDFFSTAIIVFFISVYIYRVVTYRAEKEPHHKNQSPQ